MRLPLYVCMSVMYVCDSDSEDTTPTNSLIFGMKVGELNVRKVTSLIFD